MRKKKKIIPARFMDRPEDYVRMGTKPGVIEPWEDGMRDDGSKGHYEWWYFDFILDDGSTAVAHFNTKDRHSIQKEGIIPSVVLKITDPNGQDNYSKNAVYKRNESSMSREKCEVKFGPNRIEDVNGDNQVYHVFVDPAADGIGCDLTLTSLAKPWRPGAGGFAFNEDDQGFFTWLCVVPKGDVTGTLTYNGKTVNVTGKGYHDHQWGNMSHMVTWDHWIWGREDLGDYTLVIFNIVTKAKFGNKMLPMTFIQNADGDLILEQTTPPLCKVPKTYVEAKSGKVYPKEVVYNLKQGNAEAEYTITQKRELESRYEMDRFPKWVASLLKKRDFNPSTTRNLADGTLELIVDGKTVKRSGELIYEFVYMGNEAVSKMENRN